MRRVLLDTSAYSAFQRGHPQILDAVQLAAEIFFTPIVLGELEAGFRKGQREAANRDLLAAFLSSPVVAVAPLGEETARRYGLIHGSLRRRGTQIPTNDLWIAASAMEHGLELLTTDRHFLEVSQISARVFSTGP